MNILLSGSGSGGHIYPCISTYKYLQNKHNVFIVIFKQIDKKIYNMNNVNYIYIDNSLSIKEKLKQINEIFKEKKIDISMTFGGKNSLFINIVAKINKAKIYIFEQNAILGKANKINYLLCDKLFTNFKLNKKKEENIGNPNTFDIKREKIKLFDNDKMTILITLGSLGSSSVNKIIKSYIENCDDFNIIYVLGNNIKDTFKEKENVRIYEYYNPLSTLIYNCDLVISRAGASTLSEIVKLNIPSIIIPSPYVSNNHQYKNAKHLYDNNAIELLNEKDLTLFSLKSKIYKLLLNKNNYFQMKENLLKFNNNHSFETINKVINNANSK